MTNKEWSASKEDDLCERVRELECLYGISHILQESDKNIETILQEVVRLLPPAWQYPEITCAEITFNSDRYFSKSFRISSFASFLYTMRMSMSLIQGLNSSVI